MSYAGTQVDFFRDWARAHHHDTRRGAPPTPLELREINRQRKRPLVVDHSPEAERFRAERRAHKALEWTRQKKALGLKPVVERSLPPEREPVNQWRRGRDGLLVDESDALSQLMRGAWKPWRR